MRCVSGLVVRAMVLVLAAPAGAQDLIPERGEYFALKPLGSADEGSVPLPTGSTPSFLDRFEDQSQGVSRTAGTLPLVSGAQLNIGLISIHHIAPRELARRRTDPYREMSGPRSRVAALALSLRF